MSTCLIWLLIAAILFFIDFITSPFLLFGFGIGCVVAAISTFFISFWYQFVLMLLVGTLVTIISFKKIKSKLKETKQTSFKDTIVNSKFKAEKDFKAGDTVQHLVRGVYWNVVSDKDVKKGDELQIIELTSENLLKIKNIQGGM